MHRFLFKGAKLFKCSHQNYPTYFTFSSEVNQNTNVDVSAIAPKDLYSSENYLKIQEFQQMTYQSLIEEVKKYSGKPKSRTKNALLQFLIEQIPKHASKKQSVRAQKSMEHREKGASYADSMEQNIAHAIRGYEPGDLENSLNKVLQSSLLREIQQEIGVSKHHLQPFTNNKALPYLETYPDKQVKENLAAYTNVELKREMEQFLQRSPLYTKTSFSAKTKKAHKENIGQIYKDLVYLHREYTDTYKNSLKQLLSDTKGKVYNTLDYLEVVRNLDSSLDLSKIHPYLQTLSSNALIKFWKIIFDSLEKYNMETLDIVLRVALILKEKYNLNYTESGEEGIISNFSQSKLQLAHVFEKLYAHAVNLVQTSNQTHPISSLAGLINSFRRIYPNLNASQNANIKVLGNTIVKRYMDEYFDNPPLLSSLTPRETLNIGIAVLYSGEEELTALIPDVFQKLKQLNLNNFDKEPLKEFLLFLSNMKIPASKEITQELLENPKLLDSLCLFDIYLLLHTFKESKVHFSKTYIHLYLAFMSILENRAILSDMNSIILSAKIMGHILEYHLGEHRKNTVEKKSNFVLTLIEKSLDVLEDQIQVIDLIEISSIFIPHLNTPDFLFKKILMNLDDLKLTNDNKSKITRFVNRFIDKVELKYTFNTYLTSIDLEFNDKFSEFAITIFKKLVQKFRESNLLTYVMLNIRIASNTVLLKLLFPEIQTRKAFLDYLFRQVVGFSSNVASIGLSHLNVIFKFVHINSADVNPNIIVLIQQKLLPQFLNHYNKPPKSYNELLEWIYYISLSLDHCARQELSPGNTKALEALVKKLRDFVKENIINQFSENSSLTIQQIIYDKDVSQYFNCSVFNTNFEGLEYLLPIINATNLPVSPTIEKNIIQQYPRCIKRWHGRILVHNLLLLDQFKIHCPELFEFSVSNLFSCFIFYFDTQNFILNQEILTENEAVSLLKAFVHQEEKKYFKEINNSIGQADFTKQNSGLIPLGALLHRVMHLLTPEEIIKIVGILADERKNFTQAFIDKFAAIKIKDISAEKALELKSLLPTFLQNGSINEIVFHYVETNKKDTVKVFPVISKEKLLVSGLSLNLKDEIIRTKSLPLFRELLSYLSETDFTYNDLSSVIELVKSFGIDKFTAEDKINLLSIFYINQIQNPSPNKPNDKTISEKYKTFLKPLCTDIIRSETFYYYENVVVMDGKTINIRYYGSFELSDNLKSNTFKILPKNKTGSLETRFSIDNPENNLFVSQTGANEENLFETSKAFEEQTIKSQYKKIAIKHFLYEYFYDLAELEPKNEQLLSGFLDLQNKNFNLVKFKEQFANFLIDITLILHELGQLYKTNFVCEQSHILVDIALIDYKVAIIFVDLQETVSEIRKGEKNYLSDNFNRMKADSLERFGWKVVKIIYEDWIVKNHTKEKKEYSLKKAIEQHTNLEFLGGTAN